MAIVALLTISLLIAVPAAMLASSVKPDECTLLKTRFETDKVAAIIIRPCDPGSGGGGGGVIYKR
ncbi:MAG: hypothetical protein QXJ02_00345 [Candidatus Bathyarchaeia archaeon]